MRSLPRNNDSSLAIQYLRAASATAIVCFHAGEQYGMGLRLCGIGTDFFFVISGYVLWVRAIGKNDRPVSFLAQRCLRIIPLYWIVSVTTAIVSSLKPQFFQNHSPGLASLMRSLFFIPAISGNVARPYMVQGLTLSYMVLFYVLFATGLMFNERHRYWYIITVLAALSGLHFTLPYGYSWVFTSPIILEFAAGIVIARALTHGRRIPSGIALSLSVCGMAAFVCLDLLEPELDRLFRRGLPAALVLAGILFVEQERTLPRLAIPNLLGTASYSIYLWHVLASACVTALLLRLGAPASAQPWIVIGGSVGLSLVAYALVEAPLGRAIARRRKRRAATSPTTSGESPARYVLLGARPSLTAPVSLGH